MQNSTFCLPRYKYKGLKKLLLVMKLTTLIILIGFMYVSAASYGQRININAHDITIDKLFKELKKQTGYTFLYKSGILKDQPTINVDIADASITDVLDKFLKDRPLDYLIVDKSIVIRRKTNAPVKESGPILFIGKVLNEDKKPLPGVTIKVKGAQVGQTVSNEHGEFSILAIGDDAVLQFSYVGYESQELKVKGLKNPLTIVLKASLSNLDQVQVTAYGTTTKRLNTGNITTISGKEIAENPVPNVLQALQGRVPGLFIQQMSGQAASPYSINIRGQNSLQSVANGANQPLIIVDGVQYPGGKLPLQVFGQNLSVVGSNSLNYLDPQSIASVDVLKDADATAIYGSRGAYGVILITTKRGQPGEPKLTVNNYTGVSVRGTSPQLLNLQQYLDMRREAFKNDGATPGPNDLDVNGSWPTDRSTDFQHVLTGTHAITSSSNATYSGGSGNVSYLVGGNYNVQNNIERNTGNNKSVGLNFNLNSTSKNGKFSITLVNSYSSTINTEVPVDFSFLTAGSLTSAPNAPPLTNPDGSLNWNDYAGNPLAELNQIYKNVTNNLTSSTQFKYKPIDGLTLNASFNYNKIFGREQLIQPSSYFDPNTTFFTSSDLNIYDQSTWTFEPNANYTSKLGAKGTLSVTAGATLQGYSGYNQNTSGNDFISDALLYDPTSSQTASISTSFSQTLRRYLGYFGIINYNWDNKYIIDLNGRRDGSSKFGINNQFGSFGSIGAAWIMSDESWFKKALPFISFAKLRGSYGTVGGDGIADYLTLNTYTKARAYETSLGISPTGLANPYLQWEKDLKKEIGLNLEFLNGTISFDGDYYDTRVSNQLTPQFLSSVTGFTSITLNRDAVIHGYGFEFVLTTHNIKGKNFSWTTVINGTVPKSILVSYPGLATSGNADLVIGKSVNGIRTYQYTGVNPQTGTYNFLTRTGQVSDGSPFSGLPQLDQNLDRTQFIDLNPKYYGGITNSFRYKNVSLDVLFTITNRMGRNSQGQEPYPPGIFFESGYNPTTAVLSRWQKPGDITNVAKFSQSLFSFFPYATFAKSSGAYSNATYGRLQNLNLSYTFPASIAKKAGLSALRIYVQGQNLFTISKYGDLDPENLGAGMAPLRIITGGITLTL